MNRGIFKVLTIVVMVILIALIIGLLVMGIKNHDSFYISCATFLTLATDLKITVKF